MTDTVSDLQCLFLHSESLATVKRVETALIEKFQHGTEDEKMEVVNSTFMKNLLELLKEVVDENDHEEKDDLWWNLHEQVLVLVDDLIFFGGLYVSLTLTYFGLFEILTKLTDRYEDFGWPVYPRKEEFYRVFENLLSYKPICQYVFFPYGESSSLREWLLASKCNENKLMELSEKYENKYLNSH